jgi:hypothetical protein
VGSSPEADFHNEGWMNRGAAMRKNLQQIPVYAADAIPSDPPIDWITPAEADKLVDAGGAISVKGRAIRLRKQRCNYSPGGRAIGISANPSGRLTERYAEAQDSSRDPAVIAVMDGVGGWAGNRGGK